MSTEFDPKNMLFRNLGNSGLVSSSGEVGTALMVIASESPCSVTEDGSREAQTVAPVSMC